MIDVERKKAILRAEREFERKERLSRALAERGVTLIGTITSPDHSEGPVIERRPLDLPPSV